MRRFIAMLAGVSLLVLVGVMHWRSYERYAYGFALTRYGDATIRISWGTGSGSNISPKSSMRFFLGFKLESGIDGELPVLSSQKNVWMYDVAPERMGGAVPASYVNPLNDHAFEQMIEMLRLWQGGNSNAVRMTQIAARNYTYLGFVVMNEEDVRLLKSALADRAHVSLDQDISTRDGVLYRITSGVEKHFANDPSDEDELREIRKTIPIMFEVLDSNSGHPCDRMNVLYMDGHVENTPFGSKFPATQTFVDEFRPPKL